MVGSASVFDLCRFCFNFDSFLHSFHRWSGQHHFSTFVKTVPTSIVIHNLHRSSLKYVFWPTKVSLFIRIYHFQIYRNSHRILNRYRNCWTCFKFPSIEHFDLPASPSEDTWKPYYTSNNGLKDYKRIQKIWRSQ